MAVVVVAINPSEIFKKTRDTRRSSDLKTLNNAISYFQVSLPDASLGELNTIYVSIPDSSATCDNLGLPHPPSGWFYQCSTVDNYQKVDGTGWIPVNFKQMDIGTPLSVLPIDPINQTSTGNYYTYVVGGSWEISAICESQKYLKEKSGISELDKKKYNDSASALRNFLRLRAEKILKLLLIQSQKIEVHEDELEYVSLINKEISKWIQYGEEIVKGEGYEA